MVVVMVVVVIVLVIRLRTGTRKKGNCYPVGFSCEAAFTREIAGDVSPLAEFVVKKPGMKIDGERDFDSDSDSDFDSDFDY